MEKDLLGNNPKQQKLSAFDEFFASRPQRPDEYHEGFILKGESL